MAEIRHGDWIETYTGKKFWPLDPRPEEVCIEDIAHGLSNICRFNGQTRHFYSVAQHSINCTLLAERKGYGDRLQMLMLLHDAAEAYISDIAKPIKPFLTDFKEIENRIQKVIYTALNIMPPDELEERLIKDIDTIMLVTEGKALMPFNGWGEWSEGIEPDDYAVLTPVPPSSVKAQFWSIAKKLGARLGARI
ncbi:MAG: hypothetical protein AB7V60_05500 [Candidatus Caldatribacteriota bacterium]